MNQVASGRLACSFGAVKPEKAQRLLLVFAHPDDESFAAGGLIAAVAAAGGHVTSVTVTRADGPIPAAVREAELLAAMAELGVNDVVLLRRPGYTIDPTDPGVHEHLRRLLVSRAPDVVITHSDCPGESRGHAAVSVAVSAARRTLDHPWPTLLHTIRTPEWVERFVGPIKSGGGMATGAPAVTREEELAAHLRFDDALLELKMRAVRCHASQVAHVEAAVGTALFRESMREEHFRFPKREREDSAGKSVRERPGQIN